ncbi:MAG: GMC family oxidoreductase N-terminal domain-containing protein [Nocardioidaceae bacterium]|nr:GMC family oxidoreductase N-terminal domain-containing protein [Nocardioidaceae bacterium]
MPAHETFDYVVIGAGSAGAVIAHRLSEDPTLTVLLLEAGPAAEAMEISMPAAFPNLFRTKWDWQYSTTAQPGLGGKHAYWPRMKALGGCSSMNAMMYVRGARADFDGWKRDFGAVGWGYEDVLPYFLRSEGNAHLGGRYHNADGPLHVETRRYTHETASAWVESARAAGLATNDDFNGETQVGAGLYQANCKGGRRWSTASAFLGTEVMARPNLSVRTGALVTRVLLEQGRANGVAYLADGAEHRVQTNAEVVLCGGAINSPQLLMLSGIGPAAHLAEHGIDVVVDSPGVGSNLHDHPVTPMVWHTRGTTDVAVDHVNPGRLLQWQLTGRGPLSSNIGEAGGFMHTRSGLEGPDIQFIVAPTGFYDNGFREARSPMVTTGVVLVDVESRGQLRLRGSDPRWRPEMDPAYFAERSDLDAVRAGMVQAREIAAQGPFAEFLQRPMAPIDDASLDAYIQQYTQTLYHPVGTCAMGSGDGAVVDPQLRVRGVEGLRVADASVMPKVTRGNTNAPSIMIGEKAADLLRGTQSIHSTTKSRETVR